MVSIPSTLVVLVMGLAGALSPGRRTTSPASAFTTLSTLAPSRQQIESDETSPDATWQHAMRTDVVHPARSSVSQRDGSSDRRERTANASPAWLPLARAAAHESRTAGLDARARASTIGAPGLSAPSSRAPPIA